MKRCPSCKKILDNEEDYVICAKCSEKMDNVLVKPCIPIEVKNPYPTDIYGQVILNEVKEGKNES